MNCWKAKVKTKLISSQAAIGGRFNDQSQDVGLSSPKRPAPCNGMMIWSHLHGNVQQRKRCRNSDPARRCMKRGKELKRDIETGLLSARGKTVGGIGTARMLGGVPTWLTKANGSVHLAVTSTTPGSGARGRRRRSVWAVGSCRRTCLAQLLNALQWGCPVERSVDAHGRGKTFVCQFATILVPAAALVPQPAAHHHRVI